MIRHAFLSAPCLVVPFIVLGESLSGVRQSKHHSRYEKWLANNLLFAVIDPVTASTSGLYVGSRLWLKSNDTQITSNDLWIAAMTLEHRIPQLSNDSHIDLLPGIKRIPF